jgi:biopolymer transport protein ExbB
MRGSLVVLALAGCSFSPNNTPTDAKTGSDGGSPIDAPNSDVLFVGIGNTTELDNFPLLAVLDSTTGAFPGLAKVTDPETGFTFADASGTQLDYDVDHWDPNGTSTIWIRVPAIIPGGSGSDYTQLTMSYGGSQTAAQPFSVWSTYTQVLHFDTVAATDSAGTHYEPSPTNITTRTGMIGSAAGFGSSSEIAFSNGTELYSHWDAFTLQFWLYVDTSPVDQIIGVMDEGSNAPLSDGNYDPYLDSGDFQITWNFDDTETRTTTLPVSRANWTLLTITWDGSNMIGYVNGMQQDLQMPNITPNRLALGSVDSFVLGDAGGNAMSGAIDELEVDRVAHTADWILSQYRAQTNTAVSWNAVPLGP